MFLVNFWRFRDYVWWSKLQRGEEFCDCMLVLFVSYVGALERNMDMRCNALNPCFLLSQAEAADDINWFIEY